MNEIQRGKHCYDMLFTVTVSHNEHRLRHLIQSVSIFSATTSWAVHTAVHKLLATSVSEVSPVSCRNALCENCM